MYRKTYQPKSNFIITPLMRPQRTREHIITDNKTHTLIHTPTVEASFDDLTAAESAQWAIAQRVVLDLFGPRDARFTRDGFSWFVWLCMHTNGSKI